MSTRRTFFFDEVAAPPAEIGTPVSLGSAFDSTTVESKTITLAGGVNAPAGHAIFVATNTGSAGTGQAVTDSQGNTYSQVAPALAQGDFILFYCANPVALGPGDTISLNWTTATRVAMVAFSVEGIAHTSPLDVTGTPVTGAAATTFTAPATSGMLAQPVELMFAFTILNQGGGTWTEDSDFTELARVSVPSGNWDMFVGYRITSVTTSVDYNPTWTTPRNYGAAIITFKGA